MHDLEGARAQKDPEESFHHHIIITITSSIINHAIISMIACT